MEYGINLHQYWLVPGYQETDLLRKERAVLFFPSPILLLIPANRLANERSTFDRTPLRQVRYIKILNP